MTYQEGKLPISAEDNLPSQVSTASLAKLSGETTALLQKIIQTSDLQQTKDLTYLFNINQNKKTAVRINKLNGLLDLITNEAIRRISQRPDQISTKQLLDSLKIVQASIQAGQRQIADQLEQAPTFIQINNQSNEINFSDTTVLDRESRNRVKNAVKGLLNSITALTDTAEQPIVVQDYQEENRL